MILKESTSNMASFSEAEFEQKLLYLKDTHDSISNLSSWCLSKHEHHGKIIATWLNVLKSVKLEHRLLLFYLANDVIQYSKRKSLPFVDAFAPALQKATTMVREDAVRNKILRLFKIWDERSVYDEGFLVDLSSLLSHSSKNTNGIDLQDFQPSVMYTKIRSCKELEDDTDLKLKLLNENHISFTDVDKLRTLLKDRTHGEDVITDFDEGVKHVKQYIDALEAEIKERNALIDLLEIGEQHYSKEFKEAKVVVNAYKCFATRVRGVKRKLEEQIDTMPSPIPSPDINAPSPSPEPRDTTSDGEEYNKDYYSDNDKQIGDSKTGLSYSETDLYIPSDTIARSSPKVYVPPQVQKREHSEEYTNNYSKSGKDHFYTPNENSNSSKSANYYPQPIADVPPTFQPIPKAPSNYFSKSSSESQGSPPNPPQANFYNKPSDESELYSPTQIKPPIIKQEFFAEDVDKIYGLPDKLPGLDDEPYFPKPPSNSYILDKSYSVGKPYYNKPLNDKDRYSPFSRDEYSRSSNDENLYSPTDKILPENFNPGGSFSKTPFAETLKDFYLSSRNASPPPDIKIKIEPGLNNGPDIPEGKSIEVVDTGGASMALSALLQTLIPPENSKTLLTIQPVDVPNNPPTWDTPESPPGFEKFPSGFEDQTQDVDMRFFGDVDHRNLISLTDSEEPEWGGNNDADYRNLPPPDSPKGPPPPVIDDNQDVDMEMSDDEEKMIENKGEPAEILEISPGKKKELLDIPIMGRGPPPRTEERFGRTLFNITPVTYAEGLPPPPPPPPPPPQPVWPQPGFPPPPPDFQAGFRQSVPIFFNRPPPPPQQLPPHQGQPHHGPPHQGPPHQGPPHPGLPHQGPPHQGPPHQGPPHQGPPHQGPPHPGLPHQGPPHQGPPHQGPPHQGPPLPPHPGLPIPPQQGSPLTINHPRPHFHRPYRPRFNSFHNGPRQRFQRW